MRQWLGRMHVKQPVVSGDREVKWRGGERAIGVMMRMRWWMMMRERESLNDIWRFDRRGVDTRGISTKHAFSMGGVGSALGSYKGFRELRSAIDLMPP